MVGACAATAALEANPGMAESTAAMDSGGAAGMLRGISFFSCDSVSLAGGPGQALV